MNKTRNVGNTSQKELAITCSLEIDWRYEPNGFDGERFLNFDLGKRFRAQIHSKKSGISLLPFYLSPYSVRVYHLAVTLCEHEILDSHAVKSS